ncbi:tetratricopeptide repeat protein [Streptomyces diastatochromogenes]|nr:tetratricopeptide repeat protein [Streptomyces diastatochromogenes]
MTLGVLLHGWDRPAEAEPLLRAAAGAGHVRAMEIVGYLLRARGEHDEALLWYRRSAEGAIRTRWPSSGPRQEQGALSEAEDWYRRAAGAGLADAAYVLGKLLHERGETVEAERWARRAADGAVRPR